MATQSIEVGVNGKRIAANVAPARKATERPLGLVGATEAMAASVGRRSDCISRYAGTHRTTIAEEVT